MTSLPVYDKKFPGLDAHESQMYEWLPWIGIISTRFQKDKNERIQWLAKQRAGTITPEIKTALEKWYGKDKKLRQVNMPKHLKFAEYGTQPNDEQIKTYFRCCGK